jgi:hypothetical protein
MFYHTLQTILLTLIFLLRLPTPSCSSNFIPPDNTPVDHDEYTVKCEEIPVSELTENADDLKGKLIKISGEVVVYFQKDGITQLIIGVKDETYILPSGLLPVFIAYNGSTAAFINDKVTVYGEIYGYDVCSSPQIEEKVLPRVDAKFIEII